MFRHVIYESWLNWVPWVSFAVTGSVFLICAGRALFLKKEKTEHLAHLPLDD